MSEQQYQEIVRSWMKSWGYQNLTSGGSQADLVDRLTRSHIAEATNIADMAPGTTFTAEVRFLVDSHGTALSHSGFNPCTVRDVTPPPATPGTES